MPLLADHHMVRIKIKGTGTKAASAPHQEPNFYALPPVPALMEIDCDTSLDATTISCHDTDCDLKIQDNSLGPSAPLSSDIFWEVNDQTAPVQMGDKEPHQSALDDDDISFFGFISDDDELMGFMVEQLLEVP
jgi:hypothetical protein